MRDLGRTRVQAADGHAKAWPHGACHGGGVEEHAGGRWWQAVRSAPAPCRRAKGRSSPLLPLLAAVHPAKQRVEPAARRLPHRARRRARVLPCLGLGLGVGVGVGLGLGVGLGVGSGLGLGSGLGT